MNNKYFKVFSNLSTTERKKTNLIIDGTNTFLRSHIKNGMTNNSGIHVGAISGFLLSMGYAIKQFKPDNIFIVFDGLDGRTIRRKIYPEYKINRDGIKTVKNRIFETYEQEQDAMKFQMKRLIDYFKLLPVKVLIADYVEADDIIAFLVNYHTENINYIMSTDQDFLQLINKDTFVWSPTKKILYDSLKIKEEFNLNVSNYLIYKSIIGDISDNIKGIKSVKHKTLQKILPILFESEILTLEDIKLYLNITENKIKAFNELKQNFNIVELNYTIIQLHTSLLNENQQTVLKNSLKQPVPKLNKPQFISLGGFDGVNIALKNPIKWVDQVFSKR